MRERGSDKLTFKHLLLCFVEFILSYHKYTKNEIETAAAAVNAGCNLELGLPFLKKNIYSYLGEAVAEVRLCDIAQRKGREEDCC